MATTWPAARKYPITPLSAASSCARALICVTTWSAALAKTGATVTTKKWIVKMLVQIHIESLHLWSLSLFKYKAEYAASVCLFVSLYVCLSVCTPFSQELKVAYNRIVYQTKEGHLRKVLNINPGEALCVQNQRFSRKVGYRNLKFCEIIHWGCKRFSNLFHLCKLSGREGECRAPHTPSPTPA